MKEVFFTQKGRDLYAIAPIYPDGKLTLKKMNLPRSAKITMLGQGKDLAWKQKGENVEVQVPAMNPSKMPCRYAYTFKISGVTAP